MLDQSSFRVTRVFIIMQLWGKYLQRGDSKRVASVWLIGDIKYGCFRSCKNSEELTVLVNFLCLMIYQLFFPSANLANIPHFPDNSVKFCLGQHSLPSVSLFAYVSFSLSFNPPTLLSPPKKPYQKDCMLNAMFMLSLFPHPCIVLAV